MSLLYRQFSGRYAAPNGAGPWSVRNGGFEFMKRRHFLSGASLAAGAALASALPKPAIAQDKIEWKMVTSWPRGLPGLATGAERLAERIGKLSGGPPTGKGLAGGGFVP